MTHVHFPASTSNTENDTMMLAFYAPCNVSSGTEMSVHARNGDEDQNRTNGDDRPRSSKRTCDVKMKQEGLDMSERIITI